MIGMDEKRMEMENDARHNKQSDYGIEQRNRVLLIAWGIMAVVLMLGYLVEVIRQQRTPGYFALMAVVTVIPLLICAWLRSREPESQKLYIQACIGFFVMYLFVMATGNTHLTSTYVIPFLFLLVIYHRPLLSLLTGAAALIINLVCLAVWAINDEITSANGRDEEILLILIIFCTGIAFLASLIFDAIDRSNREYVDMLDKKTKQIQNMTLQTIETIANTIDAKDDYTQGHSRRVASYSAAIAREMGMSNEEVENIRFIAMLHDIGKIGVPDSVLNKPGRLTDAEYELMKQHTVKGGEILKDIGMIPDLDVGAKCHHERYDGKGYPQGLKGEEIPKVARIIGLADAYDAMTSNRVYRQHLTNDVVMAEIKRCRGTQFDPEVTDAFLNYLNRQNQKSEEEEKEDEVDAGNKILKKFMADQSKIASENAERDSLTGVYNRSAGERYITVAMREKMGILLLVNVDDMRTINQKYGFRRGDYYLQKTAKILTDASEDMIISRFGGDEFLCFLPDVTKEENINQFMEGVLRTVEHAQDEDLMINHFTISVGITVYDTKDKNLQQLLLEADRAVYHVKQTTKNDYYIYQEEEDYGGEVLSAAELANLIDTLRRKDNFSEEVILGSKDFARVYEFVRDVAEKRKQSVALVMFTALPRSHSHMSVEGRDAAIGLLDQAIVQVVKDENAVSHYSSMQRILIVLDKGDLDVDKLANNVMVDFYRMYDKNDMELSYEIAKLEDE